MINKNVRAGIGVMILRDNKVLLGRRHADPDKASSELHGEGTWTMPGGKVDYKEKLGEAATREVFEEIGIKINKSNLQVISVTDEIEKDVHFVTIGFLYQGLDGEPKIMEPDEIVEWQWFRLDSPPENMFPPSRKILNKFIKGAPIY